MIDTLVSGGLLVVALGLAALLLTLRWVDGLLRSHATRRLLHRVLLPSLELATVAATALWLLEFLAADVSLGRLLPLAVIVLGLGWAGRHVLDDFVNGIVLRMDGSLELGRTVRIGEADGLVRRIGYRTLEIETDEGALNRVPFSQIARSSLVTTAVGQRAHTFTLEVQRDRSLSQFLTEVPATALLSPWSSITRLPRVELRGETERTYLLEITTYSLDPAYASHIEAMLRQTFVRGNPSAGP